MARLLRSVFAQHAPCPADAGVEGFADDLAALVHAHPDAQFVAFPEVHLFGGAETADDEDTFYRALGEPIPGPRTAALGELARQHGIWLLPGSVPELTADGDLFNTSLVFAPEGELVNVYRKVFPWRPAEPWVAGSTFSAFDAPGIGRLGVNICYDSWYPEATRQIAWLGAEAVVNIVKTTTPDRAQELVLARANAITNQVFYLSLNAAGPDGMGRSIFVGPQGEVLHECADDHEETIALTIDLDDVTRTRRDGTAGTNRLWEQFRPDDARIELPAYGGSIDPAQWHERQMNADRANGDGAATCSDDAPARTRATAPDEARPCATDASDIHAPQPEGDIDVH